MDREIPIEERLEINRKANKDTPRPKHLDFTDTMHNEKTLYRCVYCNKPMFEVGRKDGGRTLIGSCATEKCPGNQNTKISPYWLSLKRKQDDKLEIRNGVWTRNPYGQ